MSENETKDIEVKDTEIETKDEEVKDTEIETKDEEVKDTEIEAKEEEAKDTELETNDEEAIDTEDENTEDIEKDIEAEFESADTDVDTKNEKTSEVEIELKKVGFRGYIMRSDIPVARIEDDKILPVVSKRGDTIMLMPIYIQRTLNLLGWLKMRAADAWRENIMVMRRHFGFNGGDRVGPVMAMHAAVIGDDFWIKPDNEEIDYEDVKFKSDNFFKQALEGVSEIKKIHRDFTPEFTTIGKSNKGWFLEDGNWFLSKSESDYAAFSELFASALATLMRIKAVPYFIKDKYLTSKNFVPDGFAYEPIYSVIGSEDDLSVIADVISDFGLLKPYLDMLFIDAIVNNVERHNFKYGFITNSENLEIEMSPYFGCDSGMFATGISSKVVRKKDSSIDKFITTYRYVKLTKGLTYKPPELKKQYILGAFQWTQKVLPISVIKLEDVVEICGRGYTFIMNEIN